MHGRRAHAEATEKAHPLKIYGQRIAGTPAKVTKRAVLGRFKNQPSIETKTFLQLKCFLVTILQGLIP